MSDYKDYQDIIYLMKTPEWRTWISFIENRKEWLLNKLYHQVKARDYDTASRTAGVIEDITKQLTHFKNKRIELEEQFTNKEE